METTQAEPRMVKFKIIAPRYIGSEENATYVFASPEWPTEIEIPDHPNNKKDPTLYPPDAKIGGPGSLKPHYAPQAVFGAQHPHSSPLQVFQTPPSFIAPSGDEAAAAAAGVPKGKRPSDTKAI